MLTKVCKTFAEWFGLKIMATDGVVRFENLCLRMCKCTAFIPLKSSTFMMAVRFVIRLTQLLAVLKIVPIRDIRIEHNIKFYCIFIF